MTLLWNLLIMIGAALLSAIIGFIVWWWWMTRSRRSASAGYEYVVVEKDGSAREVTADERDYLETEFSPADGARPYVKFRYESLDGWGSRQGFLLRRQLPRKIPIAPVEQSEDAVEELMK